MSRFVTTESRGFKDFKYDIDIMDMDIDMVDMDIVDMDMVDVSQCTQVARLNT